MTNLLDASVVEDLVARALSMVARAYAPYSRFQVGAAVLAASGRIYTGANVENASFGATVCAERNAIAAAVCHGERRLVALAVAGGRDGRVTDFCPPCGICRQVMREFCDPRTFQIFVARTPTDHAGFTLDALLPESFGPETPGLRGRMDSERKE